jgi:pimeloyl-ACP methyl ester carboxylesterase
MMLRRRQPVCVEGGWCPQEGRVPRLGLRYLESGAGDPVLLLHGWAAFKEIWWGTLREIAPHYHGVALEWPGHGGSPPLDRANGLSDLADLAAESSAQLGLGRLTVVGHSMGGRVAALLALTRPDLVGRLVLVDAALDPAHIARYGRRMLRLRDIELSVRVSQRLGRGLGRLIKPATHDHPGGVIRPALRRAYYSGLADPRALHRYVRALYQESVDERLGEIPQPTLVITGERDQLVLPRQAYRAAEAIPNAELKVIPRAFHNPMDERPADFYRALLEFLDATPPLPPPHE